MKKLVIYICFFLALISYFMLISCEKDEVIHFPKDFFWGTAISAHQAEGYNYNDWTEWEQINGKILNGERSGAASNHYYMFEEDFRYAESFQHNAFRFSIEWSRIEPKRDQFDYNAVAHYHQVLDSLKRHGLKPFITLHHFTNPVWVLSPLNPQSDLDGWENAEVRDEFVEYCKFIASEFGDKVDYWITFCEPLVFLSHSYLYGDWPPGKVFDINSLMKAGLNIIFGHALAYHAIKEVDQFDADGDGKNSVVFLAKAMSYFIPQNPENEKDQFAVKSVDYIFNRWLLKTLTSGYLDIDFDGKYDNANTDPPEGKYDVLSNTLDMIGINYYSRERVKYINFPPLYGMTDNSAYEGEYANDMGWVIYPPGILEVMRIASEFGLPLIITENGIPDEDSDLRPSFIVSHLDYLLKAIDEGIDVRGYFYWSLIDNFEWTSGFYPRFGLLYVDYENNWNRVITSGAIAMREIISANTITEAIRKKYGEIEY